MNFYASPEYLQVVADVYFAGRSSRIADVNISGEILRLLIVDKRQAVTEVPFLDYHVPLQTCEIRSVERMRAYAPWVMRSVLTYEEWAARPSDNLEAAPFVDWSQFSSWDAYSSFIKRRHTGTIRKLHRLRRRLKEKHGPLLFSVNDTGRDVLDYAIQWKTKQLRETGHGDLFGDTRNVRYLEVLRERNLLVASTLRALGGRLLSVWLGFIYDGVWSGWIFTYDHDPELSGYSLGHQLLQTMLAHSFESGHREFDHSIGAPRYKWLYATHARLLGPLGRPPHETSPTAMARRAARNVLASLGLLESTRVLRNFIRAIGSRS